MKKIIIRLIAAFTAIFMLAGVTAAAEDGPEFDTALEKALEAAADGDILTVTVSLDYVFDESGLGRPRPGASADEVLAWREQADTAALEYYSEMLGDFLLRIDGIAVSPSYNAADVEVTCGIKKEDLPQLLAYDEVSAVRLYKEQQPEEPGPSAVQTGAAENVRAFCPLGDATGDGEVNAADARLILRFSADLQTPGEKQRERADVTADGAVTADDARRTLRASAGLGSLEKVYYIEQEAGKTFTFELPGGNILYEWDTEENAGGVKIVHRRGRLPEDAAPGDSAAHYFDITPEKPGRSRVVFGLTNEAVISDPDLRDTADTVTLVICAGTVYGPGDLSGTGLMSVHCSDPEKLAAGSLNGGLTDPWSPEHLPVYVFGTRGELDSFIKDNGDALCFDDRYDEVPSFSDAVAGCDDAFFADRSLAIAFLASPSGSYRFAVRDIFIDGTDFIMSVVRTNDPEVYTEDMRQWFVFAEVPDGALAGTENFDAVFAGLSPDLTGG